MPEQQQEHNPKPTITKQKEQQTKNNKENVGSKNKQSP